jgi:hypothetical protein
VYARTSKEITQLRTSRDLAATCFYTKGLNGVEQFSERGFVNHRCRTARPGIGGGRASESAVAPKRLARLGTHDTPLVSAMMPAPAQREDRHEERSQREPL